MNLTLSVGRSDDEEDDSICSSSSFSSWCS